MPEEGPNVRHSAHILYSEMLHFGPDVVFDKLQNYLSKVSSWLHGLSFLHFWTGKRKVHQQTT